MFLVPTLTCETTVYIDVLCLEIQNNGRCARKYHSDAVKPCLQLTKLKVINNNVIKSTLSRCLYHVHFQVDRHKYIIKYPTLD